MSKKVLGALLALVMVLSVLSVSAFAVGGTSYEEDPSAYTQNWTLGIPVSKGGSTYEVKVSLSTNYPVGPVAFRLEGVTSVTGVVAGTEYYSNPLTTVGDSGMVLMIPDTAATVPAKSVNGHIATVTYTTNNANGAVTIANDPKGASTPNGTLVAARCTAGTVNASDFVVGQLAYVDGQTVNPPAAETPVLTGVNGGFVDEENGYVYGVPASTANPTTYFSTAGYVEMVANSAGAINGTGATLNLYTDSSKGTLVKSYKLVIFGDVTGDGAVNLQDAGAVQTSANFVTDPLKDCYFFAADVNCDRAVNLQDAGAVQTAANFVTDPISANPWAA